MKNNKLLYKIKKSIKKIFITQKRCSCCKEVLPASEFHKRKGSYDGLQSVCKDCAFFLNSVRRKIKHDMVNETIRSWHRKNKDRVKENSIEEQEEKKLYRRRYQKFYVHELNKRCKNKIPDYRTAKHKLIYLLENNICDKDFLYSKGISPHFISEFFRECKKDESGYNLIKIKDLDKQSKYWYKIEAKL